MDDYFELRLEDMIPELEILERHRIFNVGEIRKIIRTRKKFHYKIQKRTKCLNDFVQYILYEMKLMRVVKTRRIKLGIIQKTNEFEMIVAKRVNKLFVQAIFGFHGNIELWLSYMKFSKQVKVFIECLNNMLFSMLSVSGHKPSLWKLAAAWEYDRTKSIESACEFLMRGLTHHPNSKILYTEAFRLELMDADMKRKDLESKQSDNSQEEIEMTAFETSSSTTASTSGNSGNANQVIDLHHVELVYKIAVKRIPEASFLNGLLNIAKDFRFTEELQAKMAQDLLTQFPNDELTWDALARRELDGFYFLVDGPSEEIFEELENMQNQISESEKMQYRRIRNCDFVYQRALLLLNTKQMWGLYLDTLIEINNDHTTLKKSKRKLLIAALEKAHEAGHMQEKYYIHWAGMYSGQMKHFETILDMATRECPKSGDLWQMRLRHYLSEGNEICATLVFKIAQKSLGSGNKATLPLWKMLSRYYHRKVEEMYNGNPEQGPVISPVLKQMFLEWLILAKNV